MKLQKLFSSVSLGVVRSDHSLFHGSITAKKYVAYRHVNASRRGISYTPIDVELEKLKLKRTVSLVVPSFQAATQAFLPSRSNGRGAMAIPRFAIVEAISRSATDESTSQKLGRVDHRR
jgi:hypothetical protein